MFLFGKGCLTIKNNLQEESQARGSFLKIIFFMYQVSLCESFHDWRSFWSVFLNMSFSISNTPMMVVRMPNETSIR